MTGAKVIPFPSKIELMAAEIVSSPSPKKYNLAWNRAVERLRREGSEEKINQLQKEMYRLMLLREAEIRRALIEGPSP